MTRNSRKDVGSPNATALFIVLLHRFFLSFLFAHTARPIDVSSTLILRILSNACRSESSVSLLPQRARAHFSSFNLIIDRHLLTPFFPRRSSTHPSFAAQTHTPAAIAGQERLLCWFLACLRRRWSMHSPHAVVVSPSPPKARCTKRKSTTSNPPAALVALQAAAPSAFLLLAQGHEHAHVSLTHGRCSPRILTRARPEMRDRLVLLRLGMWLRLDGVNLMYYEMINGGMYLLFARIFLRRMRVYVGDACYERPAFFTL
ncbi:hypothetical protein B0H19DRAFT_1271076 [Mycena capillaripes]|nr:hypothetical protein B0H19DRAFT_1271076 [Mycena capillaripes]